MEEFAQLPPAKPRRRRGQPSTVAVSVLIAAVTPILGGAAQVRSIDDVDVIRAPTVRGHLRFWWRALHAQEFDSPQELYVAESALWGQAGDGGGGRSSVDLRVAVQQRGEADCSDVPLNTPEAYALWPARREQRRNLDPAPRRKPGTRFRLVLSVAPDKEAELRNVVRAWILFGGYGGRTRRGCGSLTVIENVSEWLPIQPTRAALTEVFGRDVLAPSARRPTETARLAGAGLVVGAPDNASRAWAAALDWLREFRQGTQGEPGRRARELGAKRPSISNWPEADKIRYLSRKTSAHPPRYRDTPTWPRAGFGLPIVVRFQTHSADHRPYDEPPVSELHWHDDKGNKHDRLASPLIVKALPLAGGRFVPCALWLDRTHPPDGRVFLEQRERPVPGSEVRFDAPLLAQDDTPYFTALAGKNSLRQAFFDWLERRPGTVVLAP